MRLFTARPAALRKVLFLLVIAAASPALAAATPAARIDGQVLSQAEFEKALAPELANHDQAYREQLRALEVDQARARDALLQAGLEKLIDNRVLEAEAKVRGTTPLQVLADLPTPGISEAEVAAFYAENRAQITGTIDEVRPQIVEHLRNQRIDLATRRFLNDLWDKHGVRDLREPLRAKVATTGPSRGPADAPVTLVEFSDFQCPYCARVAPLLRAVVEMYDGRVRLVYRQLPLTSIHPQAQGAAEAALCADEQGKFWELHDRMFADQRALDPTSLAMAARAVGADGGAFDACVASRRHQERVAADVREADALDIRGTPAVFINGRLLNGTPTLVELVSVVEDELRRRGAPRTVKAPAAPAPAPPAP